MAENNNLNENKSEVWNFAGKYIIHKILIPLVECDKLIKIATFGAEHIEESVMLPNNMKAPYRLEAIKRLHLDLGIILDSTEFALKKKELLDTKLIEKLLEKIEKNFPYIQKQTSNQLTKENSIEIQEINFNVCLTNLRKIQRALCKPLNASGFIFPHTEEINFDELKESMVNRG